MQAFWFTLCIHEHVHCTCTCTCMYTYEHVNWVVCQRSYTSMHNYCLLKRANKLETAIQGSLACPAMPPGPVYMYMYMYMYIYTQNSTISIAQDDCPGHCVVLLKMSHPHCRDYMRHASCWHLRSTEQLHKHVCNAGVSFFHFDKFPIYSGCAYIVYTGIYNVHCTCTCTSFYILCKGVQVHIHILLRILSISH